MLIQSYIFASVMQETLIKGIEGIEACRLHRDWKNPGLGEAAN